MEMLNKIIDKCIHAGGDMVECFFSKSDRLRLSVRDGKLESIKKASPEGIAIRYFSSSRMAFAYSNDLSDSAIDSLISSVRRLADKTSPDEFAVLPQPQNYRQDIAIFDDRFMKLPVEDKIDYVQNLEEKALKFDPLIVRSNSAWYEESQTTRAIVNSQGLKVEYGDTRYTVGLSVVAEKSGQMYPGEGSLTVRRFSDLPEPEQIAGRFASRAVRLVGGTPIEGGDYEIVFTPRGAASILWGLYYALNGDNNYRGSSMFSKKLNTKVAADILSLIDDPHLPFGPESCPADDEGVSTSRVTLIDNGILKNYLYDTRTAAKAKTASTGSARRGSIQTLPEISASNFFIAPGVIKVDDIIASCRKGVIVEETQGWGLNSITGQYSAGISGTLVLNGKKIRPVGNVTLAASAEDLLNGIEAIGDDLEIFDRINSPTLKVKRMKIGS